MREEGARLIGNVAIEVDLGRPAHASPASRTTAGAPTWATAPHPSGKVLKGHGNNGKDGFEGVRRAQRCSAPTSTARCSRRTQQLADRLIALALARREGTEPDLAPLDDKLEQAAHASARAAAGVR